jgi:hypothetical protein
MEPVRTPMNKCYGMIEQKNSPYAGRQSSAIVIELDFFIDQDR